jgi:hypothetical protein
MKRSQPSGQRRVAEIKSRLKRIKTTRPVGRRSADFQTFLRLDLALMEPFYGRELNSA